MEFLAQLWLPIVLSAVVVWVLSFLFWAVLPFHHKDWKTLPDEAAVTGFIRGAGIAPGNYAFPNCTSAAQKKDPEFQKKWKEGPSGTLAVWPTNLSMPRNMLLTFLVYLVIGVFIGYIGANAFTGPISQKQIFQVLGAAGVAAYSFSFVPNQIWFNHTPSAIVRNIIEGVIYGLATGLIFALMWPRG
jgi:hypothetical protein